MCDFGAHTYTHTHSTRLGSILFPPIKFGARVGCGRAYWSSYTIILFSLFSSVVIVVLVFFCCCWWWCFAALMRPSPCILDFVLFLPLPRLPALCSLNMYYTCVCMCSFASCTNLLQSSRINVCLLRDDADGDYLMYILYNCSPSLSFA